MNRQSPTMQAVPNKVYSKFVRNVPPDVTLEHCGEPVGDVPFRDYKHLLSDKPLRRFEQVRPVDADPNG